MRSAIKAARAVAVRRTVPCASALPILPLPTLTSQTQTLLPTDRRTFTTYPPLLKKGKAAAKGKKGRDEDDEEDIRSVRGGEETDVTPTIEKSRQKMQKAVDWAKGLAYDGVERGRGRVTPGR